MHGTIFCLWSVQSACSYLPFFFEREFVLTFHVLTYVQIKEQEAMVNSTDGFPVAMEDFTKSMREQMWRINALLVVDTALVVIHVGAGTYGRLYHRHSLTRFLFVGASPLFLPIVSSLVSTVSKESCSVVTELTITCNGDGHPFLLLQWASLVQIVGASSHC